MIDELTGLDVPPPQVHPREQTWKGKIHPPQVKIAPHVRAREKQERERRAAVPRAIPQILRRYFGFEPMPFHVELIKRQLRGGKHIINLPTDHGKSVLGTVWGPLLGLMHNPDSHYILGAANIIDARRSVTAIQREIESNKELLADYPWIGKPDYRNSRIWSRSEFNVVGRSHNDRNPSIAVVSVLSGDIRGRRGKLILDDIEGLDARYSLTKRMQLQDFVMLEAIRCFESAEWADNPLLMLLGTPFHPDSIYFHLEDKGFEVMRMPWQKEGGRAIWPAKRAKVIDLMHVMDKKEFAIAMLMDPTGGDTSMMSLADLKQLISEGEEPAAAGITVVTLDPAAGSQARQAGYAGLATVRVLWMAEHAQPMVQVLEAHKFTEGLFEQVHAAADMAARWRCSVLYETNAQQGITYRDTFARTHPEVNLIPFYTDERNKWDDKLGITILRTLLREKRFSTPQSQIGTEGIQTLLAEIRDLNITRAHNHIAMAVWFAIRYAYEQARFANGIRIVNRYKDQYWEGGVGAFQQPRRPTSSLPIKRWGFGSR